MQFRAPAKINLSFRILHRRADGFHEIETLMAPISLFDELTLEKTQRKGIEFECSDPSIPLGVDNLVVRAAEIFCGSVNAAPALRIRLQKKIPHGAGLGGGSSDAATTLLGLNELLGTKQSHEQLLAMAARLGSDVPFFLTNGAAFCSGRGEMVSPRQLPRKLPLLLLKPNFGVPTPWAYGRWQDSRPLPEISYAGQSLGGIDFINDLERPVFEKFLFLAEMKTWLHQQPETCVALLSGSGSTLFAVLRDLSDAESLIDRAQRDLDSLLWTYTCETL